MNLTWTISASIIGFILAYTLGRLENKKEKLEELERRLKNGKKD